MPFTEILKWALVGLAGYFLGNIHTGIIISKLLAKGDVRDQGSGNAGATNMFRMLGMKASVLTLAGDMLKAALASLIGLWALGEYGALLAGALCVAGHNWPILLGFRGGRGIAATAGTLVVTQPIVFLVLFPLALIFIRLIKVVSIVSMLAVTLAVAMTLFLKWGDWPYLVYIAALWAMGIFSHRGNIKRLIDGSEFERKLDFNRR